MELIAFPNWNLKFVVSYVITSVLGTVKYVTEIVETNGLYNNKFTEAAVVLNLQQQLASKHNGSKICILNFWEPLKWELSPPEEQ